MPLSLGAVTGVLAPVLQPVTQVLTGGGQPAPSSAASPAPVPAVVPVAARVVAIDAPASPTSPVAEALVVLAPSLADLGLAPEVAPEGAASTSDAENPAASDDAMPSQTPAPVATPAPRGKTEVADGAPGLVDRLGSADKRETLLSSLIRAEQQLARVAAYGDLADARTLAAAEIGARAMAGLVGEARAGGGGELALID